MHAKTMTLAAAGLLATTAGTASAFTPWTNPSGSAQTFTYSGGGSDNGLFGDPTVIGNTLKFLPSAFRAESTNGVPDQINDRLEVRIDAKPGQSLDQLIVREFGDYGITGVGQVVAGGNVFGFNNITGDIFSAPLVTTPGMPITSGVNGQWSGELLIDFSGSLLPVTSITLTLNNDLSATSDVGSTSFIQKKVGDVGVEIEIVPAPASAALLALGGIAAVRRRR